MVASPVKIRTTLIRTERSANSAVLWTSLLAGKCRSN